MYFICEYIIQLHGIFSGTLCHRATISVRDEHLLRLGLYRPNRDPHSEHQQGFRHERIVQIWHIPPELHEYHQQPRPKPKQPSLGRKHRQPWETYRQLYPDTYRTSVRQENTENKNGRIGSGGQWYPYGSIKSVEQHAGERPARTAQRRDDDSRRRKALIGHLNRDFLQHLVYRFLYQGFHHFIPF